MSSLWTPGGEHVPSEGERPEGRAPGTPAPEASPTMGPEGDHGGAATPTMDEEQAAEQLRELRRELAEVPVADIVANHVVGLWQLAIVHLAPEGDEAPALEEASLAIDAVAALLETLGGRLGAHEPPLRDALAQLRLAFVEVSRRTGGDNTA